MKLKINSSTLNIDYLDAVKGDDNREMMGTVDYNMKSVQINKGYPRQSQLQTILHESIHVIGQEYGIPLAEDKVERLSNALYAFMIDNKALVREIVK